MRIYVKTVDLDGKATHEDMDFPTVGEMVKYVTEQQKRVLPHPDEVFTPTLKEFEWRFSEN